MTLRQLIENAKAKLIPIYGEGESTWLVRTIMEHVKQWNQVELAIRANDEVSDFVSDEVAKAIARLLKYEPIQYIYGDTYWHGMTLSVSPAVLIPRPETSELVDLIVKDNKQPDLKVLDACTGSGCIAVALAKHMNFPQVRAFDISDDALSVAKANAERQKVEIDFYKADALKHAADATCYDIIVSNPPYVLESERSAMSHNVLGYEPQSALFVPDNNPLIFYKAIADYSKKALSLSGKLYFELNPLTADVLSQWMKQQGWSDISIIPDMYAKKRFMIAVR